MRLSPLRRCVQFLVLVSQKSISSFEHDNSPLWNKEYTGSTKKLIACNDIRSRRGRHPEVPLTNKRVAVTLRNGWWLAVIKVVASARWADVSGDNSARMTRERRLSPISLLIL
jgi:hypothetical protein